MVINMTYNFIFVRDIIKILTYCDKNKFCNEIFINPQKLIDCVTNEMSREVYLKNGLRAVKVPVKDLRYARSKDGNWLLAVFTFEDKFITGLLDSKMFAICIDKDQNFRVFSLRQYFEKEDKSDLQHVVFEQQLYGEPKILRTLLRIDWEAFAVVADYYLRGGKD